MQTLTGKSPRYPGRRRRNLVWDASPGLTIMGSGDSTAGGAVRQPGRRHKRTSFTSRTMRYSLVALIAPLFLAQTAAVSAAETAPAKPKIVLIFADDLGWKDVGYQGR